MQSICKLTPEEMRKIYNSLPKSALKDKVKGIIHATGNCVSKPTNPEREEFTVELITSDDHERYDLNE